MKENWLSKKTEIRTISIEDFEYSLRYNNLEIDHSKVQLIIVSYLPNEAIIPILKIAISTIKKFTIIPYQLWIFDNNSPLKNIEWLTDEDVNVIFNRTTPKEQGSYANAIGYEITLKFIPDNTQYIMSLHQDIAVCKMGWLKYLLSKFDNKTKAVGVRLDKNRISTGVLHVLGTIYDYKVFQELNLSFLPNLPDYDTGDIAITTITNKGYHIFASQNSFHTPDVLSNLPNNSPFKTIHFDRSLDDANDVYFLHLGRSVHKSNGNYVDKKKTLNKWINLINNFVLNDKKPKLISKCYHELKTNIWYSVRRFFIDSFFINNISEIKKGGLVLDMGGKKTKKRGVFNIDNYNFNVKYANIDKKTNPDFLCDIKKIPIDNDSFDGIILSEVLEHLPNAIEVLNEAYRLLKPNGKLLICTPFLYHVHADPYDFCRYSDYWYLQNLERIGFKNIQIEKQGLFFGVIANMLKLWILELFQNVNIKPLRYKLLIKIVFWFIKKSYFWDKAEFTKNNNVLAAHTTGYGIVCKK